MSQELKIYDLLREAHKSVKEIYRTFSLSEEDSTAVDAVHNTLYLAEGYFVHKDAERNR